MFLFQKENKIEYSPEINILKTLTALFQNHEAVSYGKEIYQAAKLKDAVLYFQGLALENEGNVQQAMEQYQKALKKNPGFSKALLRLGQIYLQRTDAEKAKEYLLTASKSFKKDPEIFHSLGLAAHISGEGKKAVKYWKKALRLNKNFAPAIANLKMYDIQIEKDVDLQSSIREGEILQQRRDVEEKIKFLEVIENPQNDPYEFYIGRKGFVYLHRENYKSFTHLDGNFNFQVISKPTVKKVQQIILSLIVHVSNLDVDEVFWELAYGHGQYFIYHRAGEGLNTEYSEGRYQKKKMPLFFKFRINSSQKLDDQQLNGNILFLKEDDKFYLVDNLGTDISYKIMNSLNTIDNLVKNPI